MNTIIIALLLVSGGGQNATLQETHIRRNPPLIPLIEADPHIGEALPVFVMPKEPNQANSQDQRSGYGPGIDPGMSKMGAKPFYIEIEVDTEPVVLSSPRPHYTQEALQKHIEGTVALRVLVSPEGDPVQVRFGSQSLSEGLDEQAIQTAYNMKFKPATKGNKAVGCWTTVKVIFKLEGNQK